MNVIIIGPPGSGKGTQAQRLAEEKNLFHFSVGRLVRLHAERDPLIDSIVNQKGELVPTGIMFEMVKSHLEKVQPSFDDILFDGYPRTVNQYDLLKDLLIEHKHPVAKAIYLEVSEDEIIKRLSSRRVHKLTGETYNLISNQPPENVNEKDLLRREDDYPEAIHARMKIFEEKTAPLLEHYESDGILIKINANPSIDEVYKSILLHFEK